MEYTAKDIVHHESDIAACRSRPSLYVAQTEAVDCVAIMLQEAMSMALQSAIDGIATEIHITEHDNGLVTIRDNGPNLDPTEVRDGLPVVELLLTRFSACKDAKSINRSYFNFGIVTTNALSKSFVYEITHGGWLWRQEYHRGVPLSAIERVSESKECFRQISFLPDDSILPNTRISYDGFQRWFNENCSRIDGCLIYYYDEARNQTFDVIQSRSENHDA